MGLLIPDDNFQSKQKCKDKYFFIFPKREKLYHPPNYNYHVSYDVIICNKEKIEDYPENEYILIPISKLAKRYWIISAIGIAFINWPFKDAPRYSSISNNELYGFAASTKEMEYILNNGHQVNIASGPYETRDDADYRLDLYWDSPKEEYYE